MSADQIYAKVLPDGEARRLTNDPRIKYNLAFSPDGSQIAYTVMEAPAFGTYTVSVLGGDSHLLLHNAAGLSWLDPGHFLFSRTHSGIHLGVVTQSITGNDYRELYFPAARTGHGALLICFSGPHIGFSRGDEWTGKLGDVPAHFAQWGISGPTDRARRCVHLGRLGSRWLVDVFHRDHRRTKPPVAPALSQRTAGANHLWPHGRGRIGGGAGWPFCHHFDRRAGKRHLDS